jgi:hypothetical protein
MRLRLFAALLVAALTLVAPAAAQKPGADDAGSSDNASRGERIISYLSDISIARDASLHVVETIRVDAEGDRIRHGITRDFPTRYTVNGRNLRVGFEVEGVERDGQPEHYTRESISNGVRLRIGSASTEVSAGEHSYVIRYTTTRQIGFFDTYDELYWNAVGTDVIFDVDSAEAHIHLPQAVPFGNRSSYTGSQGSQASNAEIVSEGPGDIVFRTTRPLAPHEGFTVAVAWPKGVVTAPPPPSALAASTVGLAWWFTGRAGVRSLIDRLFLVLLLGFSTQIWWVTTRGGVWHTGQLIATILTLGCLIELWGSRRGSCRA